MPLITSRRTLRWPMAQVRTVLRHLLLACLVGAAGLQAWAQEPGQAPGQDGPAAKDAVVERSWLDDPHSSLTPQAALQGDWTPLAGLLSRGFTTSTTWVRLKIDPAAAGPASIANDHRMVLTIAPGNLDEVAVYRMGQLAQPLAMVGDTHPTVGPLRSVLFHAVVLENATEPLELLLRIRSDSTHSLYVQALRWDAAHAKSARHQAVMMGYLVFTLMAIAWAGFTWLQDRSAVAALFLAHQAAALLLAFTLLGVLRIHGPAAVQPFLSTLTSLAIGLSASVTLLFHRRVLGDLGASALEQKMLAAVAMVPMLALCAMAAGQIRTGLWLCQVGILVGMLLCALVAFQLRPQPEPGSTPVVWRRLYVAAVYTAMAVLIIPNSLRVLGALSPGPWNYFGFQTFSVVSALLLGSLLLLHAQEERIRRRRAAVVVAQTRREADAQRARAAEQAELMTMLTHELKTPLSVVSIALGSAGSQPQMQDRAMRAVGNMRDVIDRCAQASRLDDEMARHDAPPDLMPVELQEVVTRAVAAHLQARRVSLQADDSAPACLGDPQMLAVIVANLLDNALKYSPKDSLVQLTVASAASEGRPGVALRVTNPVGPAGRPEADRLFEKYYRGARARHRSGSGLGLYLSKRLAYRMAGELGLVDARADEVCFELWMPC